MYGFTLHISLYKHLWKLTLSKNRLWDQHYNATVNFLSLPVHWSKIYIHSIFPCTKIVYAILWINIDLLSLEWHWMVLSMYLLYKFLIEVVMGQLWVRFIFSTSIFHKVVRGFPTDCLCNVCAMDWQFATFILVHFLKTCIIRQLFFLSLKECGLIFHYFQSRIYIYLHDFPWYINAFFFPEVVLTLSEWIHFSKGVKMYLKYTYILTHCSLRDMFVIANVLIENRSFRLWSWVSKQTISWNEHQWPWLVASQHWLRLYLGALRQQSII